MPAIGNDGTLLELIIPLEENHRPDLYRLVLPSRGDAVTIGRPGDRIDRGCVSTVGKDGTPSGSLPDVYGHIKTCRGNIVAIRRPRDRAYAAGMPPIDDDLASAGCFPDLDGL